MEIDGDDYNAATLWFRSFTLTQLEQNFILLLRTTALKHAFKIYYNLEM